MDEGSFYFEPELDSGVFASAQASGLAALASRARYTLGADAAAVLDVSGREAKLAVAGSPIELSDEKEAVLMAWLQEVEAMVVRTTPPKLALVFGCHELLVSPIRSPAGPVGAVAVTLPCKVRRAPQVLEGLAAEWALTLEAAERRSTQASLVRSEADTTPAPAPAAPFEYQTLHAGRW